MYLLYLDDSGSADNPADRHVVLAGVALFERQPHWFSERLDALAQRVWPDNPAGLEFRGGDILSGRKHWRGVPRQVRHDAYAEALGILAGSGQVHLFGAAVHRAAVSPDDPMERAFEQICNRFDKFLARLHRRGNTQRGLIIADESTYETSLQGLARDFRTVGHRWGQLYNLADVPLFVNSRATRMVQYADMVAYATRRYFEKGDATYFDIVSHRFDAEGGVVHGLTHLRPAAEPCNCVCCRQKRS
ncbi:hypothetical protein A33M_1310 [Rhodovulum sp. PH10]|uniref:DUF3800 domain-containing protein n=1 Tax=Rhodovulum sp. PH10 TaxID=1187851 RepID=UPI00027C28A5|nr:DUF3800 domain-containing protein [Rhodovulum sp. PH10]EJW12966.1 hypothetical protein A33M_1310 [Rhodovulum sp. PH10]